MASEDLSGKVLVESALVFAKPVQCLNEVVSAYKEYKIIAEQEQTKRREITAWEKTKIAEIKAKRDLLISYLDRSFDERAFV